MEIPWDPAALPGATRDVERLKARFVRDVGDVVLPLHAARRWGGTVGALVVLAAVFCNVVVPQALWFKKIRRSIAALFALTIFVNIGMWYERFVIIVTSLAHEYEPGGWGLYTPSWVEISIIIGSFSWFFMWFLLFSRSLPVIAIAEVKEHLAHQRSDHHE